MAFTKEAALIVDSSPKQLKHSGTYMQQKSFFFVFWLQIFVAEN
jgi:hypothetical protein